MRGALAARPHRRTETSVLAPPASGSRLPLGRDARRGRGRCCPAGVPLRLIPAPPTRSALACFPPSHAGLGGAGRGRTPPRASRAPVSPRLRPSRSAVRQNFPHHSSLTFSSPFMPPPPGSPHRLPQHTRSEQLSAGCGRRRARSPSLLRASSGASLSRPQARRGFRAGREGRERLRRHPCSGPPGRPLPSPRRPGHPQRLVAAPSHRPPCPLPAQPRGTGDSEWHTPDRRAGTAEAGF